MSGGSPRRLDTSRSTWSSFDDKSQGSPIWRVAHLSDVHAVGERYGFRIESGRAGPRGNERLVRAMDRLAAVHAREPLDLVLVSGDMTDAGLSAEWAEFLDIVAGYPVLAERMLILPGNHDVNIVDRVNPARLDLPFSPAKTLRKMRALSAIAAVQGDRVVRRASMAGRAEPLSPTRSSRGGGILKNLRMRAVCDDPLALRGSGTNASH